MEPLDLVCGVALAVLTVLGTHLAAKFTGLDYEAIATVTICFLVIHSFNAKTKE